MNLSRLRYHPDSQLILYQPKAGHELDDEACLDPLEFLARVLLHLPEPNKHLVHFYGTYANRLRSSYCSQDQAPPQQDTDAMPSRRVLSKRWAKLIYREATPSVRPRTHRAMTPPPRATRVQPFLTADTSRP